MFLTFIVTENLLQTNHPDPPFPSFRLILSLKIMGLRLTVTIDMKKIHIFFFFSFFD